MKKNLFLIGLMLAVYMVQSTAFAGQATEWSLQIEGRAPVIRNDEARARGEAVRNALDKAIIMASTKILSGKSEEDVLPGVKSNLLGNVDRYIHHYSISSENRQHDEYSVNVNVVVALGPIRQDLSQWGILQDAEEKEMTSVLLSLHGVRKYSDFVHFKAFLQSRSKIIKKIYPCSLQWQRVTCDLTVLISPQDFATELQKTGRYKLVDLKNNQNIVEISLQVNEEVQ